MQFDCELSISADIANTTQTFDIYDRFVIYLDVMSLQNSSPHLSSHGWTILNSATHLVLGLRLRDHVTAALIDLHWLTVAAQIEFKLCTLVYQSVTGNAPTYIEDMLQSISGLDRQTILQSASKGDLVDLNLVNVHS